jgi:hypothetical protein
MSVTDIDNERALAEQQQAMERAATSISEELRSSEFSAQFVDSEVYADRVALFFEKSPNGRSGIIAEKFLEKYGGLELLASPDDLLFENVVSSHYIYLLRPRPELFESRQTSFETKPRQTSFDGNWGVTVTERALHVDRAHPRKLTFGEAKKKQEQPPEEEQAIPENPFARRPRRVDSLQLNGDLYADEYLESQVGIKTGGGEKFVYENVDDIPDDMLDALFHAAFFGRSDETLEESKERSNASFTARASQHLEEQSGLPGATGAAMRRNMLAAMAQKGWLWRLPKASKSEKQRMKRRGEDVRDYVFDKTGKHYSRGGKSAKASPWGGKPLGGMRSGKGPVRAWYRHWKASAKYQEHLAAMRKYRKEIQDDLIDLRDGDTLVESIHNDAVLECLGLLSCRDKDARYFALPFTSYDEQRIAAAETFTPEDLVELCAVAGMDSETLFAGLGDENTFFAKYLLTESTTIRTVDRRRVDLRAGAEYASCVCGVMPVVERMVHALAYKGIPNTGRLDERDEALVREWRMFKQRVDGTHVADPAILRAAESLT